MPPGIETKGSQNVDLTVTVPLDGGWSVLGHVGYQKIENARRLGLIENDVIDYKVGVTYDIAGSGGIVGAAVVGINEKKLFTVGDLSEGGGKTRGVFSLSKTF